MARYRGPVCRLYRREGRNLQLKSPSSAAARRVAEKLTTPPGQHGTLPRKMSTYGVQMREKQACKRVYGILERQFRRYFARAERYHGVTGHVLIQLLERRLDNVVYRAGYHSTRAGARQLVSHKHITVNGQIVNIPSYEVNPGDVIGLVEKAKQFRPIVDSLEQRASRGRKSWIEFNDDSKESKLLAVPSREDVDDIEIKEQLIVELYSK